MGFGIYALEGDDVLQATPRKKVDPKARILRELVKIEHGEALGEIFCGLPVHLSFREISPVCGWLKKMNGGCSGTATSLPAPTIVSVVCPDYATGADPCTGRRVYTFDALGDGIGLVAERALKAQGVLWNFFRERCPHTRFIIAMADQEADSEENCKRVGLSRTEFLARIRKSQRALADAAPKEMQLETPFLTEINPALWNKSSENARGLSKSPDAIPEKDVQRVINERRHFYRRWAGNKWLTENELRSMVLSQAPEYAAVGAYLYTAISDALIVAADSRVMAPFMRLLSGPSLPLLYLDKPSYH